MQRSELEGLVSVYENGFEEIESVLEDNSLSASEKIDTISAVINGESVGDEDDDEDDE